MCDVSLCLMSRKNLEVLGSTYSGEALELCCVVIASDVEPTNGNSHVVGPMRSLSLKHWHVNCATHSLSLVSMRESMTYTYLSKECHVRYSITPPCHPASLLLSLHLLKLHKVASCLSILETNLTSTAPCSRHSLQAFHKHHHKRSLLRSNQNAVQADGSRSHVHR
jgi:hypothetical protein